MADNAQAEAVVSGGLTFATDSIGAAPEIHYPINKLAYGALDSATLVSTSNGLPVAQQGTWNIGTVTTVTTVSTVSALGSGTTGPQKAEDAASANTDVGIPAMAVQKATPANTAGTDGDYEFLQMSAGRLWTSTTVTGTVTVDGSGVTQPVSNAGLTALNGAISGTEVQVDVLTLPALAAGTNNIGDVDVLSIVPGTGATNLGKAEDAAHTSGDVGVMALAVRQDTAAALGGLDGDYQPLISDGSGRLHVNVGNTVTVASHAVTNAGTFATQIDGAALTALQLIDDVVFADDAAFTLTSSKAVAVGAVRDDALSALAAAEGDIVPLRVSSTGALHVTGGGGGTQYNIDDVASATATGTVALVVRKDSAASLAGTDGDVTGLQVDANGALRVTGGGGGTEYTVDAAAPAAPTGATFVMERDDALSALTEIEGDWTNPRASANGALWVSVDGTVTVGSHTVTNAGTFVVQENGAALTALQLIDNVVLAEDAAHNTGDVGVMALAVRRDTAAVGSGTDGDYSTLNVDASGRLWTHDDVLDAVVAGSEMQVDVVGALPAGTNNIGDVDVLSIIPGTGATNLGKAEDGAHTTADTGVYVLGVRDDAPAVHSGTDGDYESLHISAEGGLWAKPMPSDYELANNTKLVKKYYTSTGAVTDGIVWSPAAGTRWHVTDIIVNVSAAATVTFEDDLGAGDSAVLKMELAANSGFTHSFTTPWASGEDAADLLVTTTAGNIYITVTGYEI